MHLIKHAEIRPGWIVQFWDVMKISSETIYIDGEKKYAITGFLGGFVLEDELSKRFKRKDNSNLLLPDSKPIILVEFGKNTGYFLDEGYSSDQFRLAIFEKLIESIPEPGNPSVETNLHSCSVFKSTLIGFQDGVLVI